MRNVHNHSWVAFALPDALFVEGKRCLVEIWVAIDLNLQAVVGLGLLIAHIAALVVDDNTKLWVILVNQRHGAWLLVAFENHFREVIARTN